jgi:hypothetical protein
VFRKNTLKVVAICGVDLSVVNEVIH